MAKKWVVEPYHILVNGDMTGDLTSASTDIKYLDNFAIQLNFTHPTSFTAVGTFTVEASVDGATWVTLNIAPAITCSASTGSHLININQIPYALIRVKYAHTSGTGLLNIYFEAKQI